MPAVNGFCSAQHDFKLTIFPYEINLYDCALCIDNNDKHMTCRAYTVVYLCPSYHHLHPMLHSGTNDVTQATNKLYALQKSCRIVLLSQRYIPVDTLKLLLLVYRGGLCRMVNIRVNTCTCMDCLPGKNSKPCCGKVTISRGLTV